MAKIAVLAGFEIRSAGASQAFSQSGNLADPDRCIVIPPALIAMSWKGSAYPLEISFESLYGTRGAPLMWHMKLSKCLIQMGLRQMKSDSCVSPKLDSHGDNCWVVIEKEGHSLYTGAFGFPASVKKTIAQFRVGEVAVATPEKCITFEGL